jgi:protein O-GlcNAc transferase
MSARRIRKSVGKKMARPLRVSDPELISLLRLVEGQRFVEVEASARRILNAKPRHPLAQKALSFALTGMSRSQEALQVLDAAISQTTEDGELYNNRAIALTQLHRWDESLRDFERARKLLPDDPELLNNLANALAHIYRWTDAIPILLEAIEKHPGDFVKAISLLGDCLFNCRRLEEARACYTELYAANNEDLKALSQLVVVGLYSADWTGLPDFLHELREKSMGFTLNFEGSPLYSLSFPGLSSLDHRRIAAHMAEATMAVASIRRSEEVKYPELQSRPKRLKVGYLSGDFRYHAVGRVLVELIEHHDQERFEFIAYSTSPREESETRLRLEAAFDRLVDISDLIAVKAASAIRDEEIDILVDLSGWTTFNRADVLAIRCAPVQALWLGYPGTLGLAGLADYIIGDQVVTPISDAESYAERIAQLPGCYLPYDTTARSGIPATRAAHGLPADAFVYCSFNGVHKYNPQVFDVWCGILRESPGSVLWLSNTGDVSAVRLRGELAVRGVAPERLIFAAHQPDFPDHLARVQLADLALDPFPYNSHTTGLDMLWAGVPLLAMRGQTFAGRVGASMLTVAGLQELVAEDLQHYREIALTLYNNRDLLASIRKKVAIVKETNQLFDMKKFVRSLEHLLDRMWQNQCAGLHLPLPAEGR